MLVIMTGKWLENCFIDELLKANDNILLKAEGTIVERLNQNVFFKQHFQQTNVIVQINEQSCEWFISLLKQVIDFNIITFV